MSEVNARVWMYAPGRFRFASNRPWWMDAMFSKRVWYRKWCGGHWENWWNDLTKSFIWERVPECTQLEHNVVRDIRPPCCYGTPLCEEYERKANNER